MNNKNYITARDVAGDARLNFKSDKWFWMPYRKGFALRGMTALFILACFPSFVQAETCTATPDCKSLGYTETSCPDGGGVKCPWNTSQMYCCKKITCEAKTCGIGDILYADKKCYVCLSNSSPNQIPIGVVFSSGKAVGLVDLSTGATWSSANTLCSNHKPGGVSVWRLPTKNELLEMYSNINAIQIGLQSAAGGSKLASYWYWSSSVNSTFSNGNKTYWTVNPVSSNNGDRLEDSNGYVRAVLAF